MKIKQHARVVAQSLLATFFVGLVVVVAAEAATTIGNNVSTGTVTTTGIVDITAAADTPLTVNGGTASTTLAVYQSSTGDILNLFDGSTEVFTVLDGGTVGVASSTPWGLLAIEQATESNSFLVMNQGSSTASFVVKGVNGDGRVGVATSSPSAMLSIGGASATSTLSMDKFCMYAGQENGVHVYVYLAESAANGAPFATTTTSCF